MLYAFGFERVGVVAGDLYFVDPSPGKGQEGPEHGVRLELRYLTSLRSTLFPFTLHVRAHTIAFDEMIDSSNFNAVCSFHVGFAKN